MSPCGLAKIVPLFETLELVGFKVYNPFHAAGILNDPPISVPIVIGHPLTATQPAPPPVLPPTSNIGFQGFVACPQSGVTVIISILSWGMVVTANITAPASLTSLT